MTKHTKTMLETTITVAIMGLVVSLMACLNPVGFSPEVKLSIDANVSGELDVYNSNNAVSWVINKTKSVDISSVRIEVVGPSLDGAPARMDILGAPKAGNSHASYHKPSKDKTSQPYQYEFTIDTVVVGNPADFPGLNLVPGERKSFSLKKFLPRAQDYAVFLIRKADGSLEFVDEEPPMSALDDNDVTNPPVPPGPATGRYPLIVRNVTKSADVQEVTFKNVPYAQEVIANVNDQKSFYMPASEYGPTFIKYQVKRTGEVKETFHQNESPRVVVIDPTVTDAQSWHLLFLYFYRSKSGDYKITQQWPPIPDDSDPEDTISANYTDTRVRVLNKVSATYVTDIVITQDYVNFYAVNASDFTPSGVISTGFDWNAHSKSAVFKPGVKDGYSYGPFVGEPWDVLIKLTDEGKASNRGSIIVKRKAVNLWVGNTYNVILTKDDVREGDDNVIVVPPATINYSVTANGGTGASDIAAYDTTTLTFDFIEDVDGSVTPAFTVVNAPGGAITLGNLTRVNARQYTATCSSPVTQIIQIACTTDGFDKTTHAVQVYKHIAAAHTTTRYFYVDGDTRNKTVPRNTSHQLDWYFRYDEVEYDSSGNELNRTRHTVEKPGSWLVDAQVMLGSNYISLTTTGLLKVGPRPSNGAITQDKVGISEWTLHQFVTFGTNPIYDGKYIENLPYEEFTLYFFSMVLTRLKYHGLPMDLTIRN